MAIYKLKELYFDNPRYGANLPALSSGKYKYVRQSDISSKNFAHFVNSGPLLSKGDILISRVGANAGDSYIHDSSEECVWAGYLVKYFFNEKKLLNKYFYYWTKSNSYITQKDIFVTGAAQPQFNPPVFGELSIKLPVISQQQKIIDIIEPIEKVILMLNDIEDILNKFIKNMSVSGKQFTLSNVANKIKNTPKHINQVSARVMKKRMPSLIALEKAGTYETNSFNAPMGTLIINTIRTYLEKFAILHIEADVNGTVAMFEITKNWTSVLHNLLNDDFWIDANQLSHGTKMPVLKIDDIFKNIKLNYTNSEINEVEKIYIKISKLKLSFYDIKNKLIKILMR